MQPSYIPKTYQAGSKNNLSSLLSPGTSAASKYSTIKDANTPINLNKSHGYLNGTSSSAYQKDPSTSFSDGLKQKNYQNYSSIGTSGTPQANQTSQLSTSALYHQPSSFKTQTNQPVKPSTAYTSYAKLTAAEQSKYGKDNEPTGTNKPYSIQIGQTSASDYQLNSNTNAVTKLATPTTYSSLAKQTKQNEQTAKSTYTGYTPPSNIDTNKYYVPETKAPSNYRSVTPNSRPYSGISTTNNYQTTGNSQSRTNQEPKAKLDTSYQGTSTPKHTTIKPLVTITTGTTANTSSSYIPQYSTAQNTYSTKNATPGYEPKKYDTTSAKPYELSLPTTNTKPLSGVYTPTNYTPSNYTPSNYTSSNYTPSNYTSKNYTFSTPSTPGGNYKPNQPAKNFNFDNIQGINVMSRTNSNNSNGNITDRTVSDKTPSNTDTDKLRSYSNYSNYTSNRYNPTNQSTFSQQVQQQQQQPNFYKKESVGDGTPKISAERESYSKEINTYAYNFGAQTHEERFPEQADTRDKNETDLVSDMTESQVKNKPKHKILGRIEEMKEEDSPARLTDSGNIEYKPPTPALNKVQSRFYPIDKEESDDPRVVQAPAPLFNPSKSILENGRSSVTQASFIQYDIPERTNRSSRKSSMLTNRLSEIGRDILSKCTEKSLGQSSKHLSLLQKLLKEGKKYEDPEFRPNIDSLAGDDLSKKQKWARYVWCRPEEFYGDGYEIFYEGIDINDIYQGILGNCYFLSVLSALAEFPHLIMKLFVTADVNKAGCYAVRICDGGEWKEIIIDDLIPCKPGNPAYRELPSPIFSRGNGKELWVMLLEKAWAKNFGSYAKIDAGFTRETMRDLTGAPTEYFIPNEDDNDLIWTRITEGEQRNYVMTCGAGDLSSGQDLLSSCGLVGSHAYSLISAVELYDRMHDRTVKLVKLRNPWGKSEWNQAWSDGDSRWTTSLKGKVGLEERDDGVFFMEFSDFVQYFSDVQICRVYDYYHYYSYRTKSRKNEYKFYRIKFDDPGHYYITVNQANKRHFKKSDQYQYSEARLLLAKVPRGKGESFEYIDGLSYGHKEVWVEGDMSMGEYLLAVNIDWVTNYNEFVISSYGPGECTIQEEMGTSSLDPRVFVEETYKSHARNNCLEHMRSIAGTGVRRAMMDRLKEGKEGIGYLFYANEDKIGFKIEVTFTRKTGIELLFQSTNASKITFELTPNETKIIVWQIGFDEASISIKESLIKC